MNTILNFYFKLPHDRSLGIVSKAFNRISARILKRILDKTVPTYFLKTQNDYPIGINQEAREKKVIVSFTSFPGRIADVWIVVECLFRQSYKADRIILWLSKPQFEGIELPKQLLDQMNRGLEIRFVEDDLRSHKKYLYAFDEFKDHYVVTVDDDLYYESELIQNLIDLKKEYPEAVVTNRAHRITFFKDGSIENYSNWNHNITLSDPSFLNVQTGGFGTLYTIGDLDVSYNDIDLIKRTIPLADDLWMKVQTLLAQKEVVTNDKYNKDPLTVRKSQIEKLVTSNSLNGGNDVQFKKVLEYFQLGNLEKYRD